MECSSRGENGWISIHAPHARSDCGSSTCAQDCGFQSTLLMRGATRQRARRLRGGLDFNPRSSCEERRTDYEHIDIITAFQSTLLMRGATFVCTDWPYYPRYFNPRSSCEERHGWQQIPHDCHISIHAPHARSDLADEVDEVRALQISIHAPHARSDTMRLQKTCACSPFQSTLLMRGATCIAVTYFFLGNISIHAPHARSDMS